MRLRAKEPRGPGWHRDREFDMLAANIATRDPKVIANAAKTLPTMIDAGGRWYHIQGRGPTERTLCAVSTVNDVLDRGPTWHVTVSRVDLVSMRGVHCSDEDLLFAREAFRMRDAEEDNHALLDGRTAGVARNLFMEVDPARRSVCECKTTEIVERLPDGFEYSRPRSGSWDGEP